MASLKQELHRFDEIIKRSYQTDKGSSNHHLKPCTVSDESEPYRKITFGERDQNKPHKTILMVGETGTGKTKLINVMVNYMLGVQREDQVWFEITDDQSDQSSVHSQTTSITVYEVYLQESPMDLTIIDTPGYGDTRGADFDRHIARELLNLSKSTLVQNVDAVCLVITASQNRLSNRQIYIYDAVQSLFGKDIAENIVLLLTHSRGTYPNKALMAVKEAKFKCAVNEQGQPVYFLFDNCQGETFERECLINQEQSWNLSLRGMRGFFSFLDGITSKPMQMTLNVLTKRNELEEIIPKIKSHIQSIELKKKDLTNAQARKDKYTVPYKVRVDIDRSVAKMAMCCTVCEENCHYPGCWWVSDLSWCSRMRNDHCTVCTNKCHYSKHVKEAKIYAINKEKKECEIREVEHSKKVKKLEGELIELKERKMRLILDAFHCVDSLEMIALNTDSLIILMYTEFLIEKLKEINEPEKVKTLEDRKERAGEMKHLALKYIKMVYLN